MVVVQGQHILCKDRKGPLHIFLCECQLKLAYKNKQQTFVSISASASAIESGKQHKVLKNFVLFFLSFFLPSRTQNILSYISKLNQGHLKKSPLNNFVCWFSDKMFTSGISAVALIVLISLCDVVPAFGEYKYSKT